MTQDNSAYNEHGSTEPKQFRCPNCGADLPAPEAAVVKCEYCGTSVLVPPEYLPKPPAPPAVKDTVGENLTPVYTGSTPVQTLEESKPIYYPPTSRRRRGGCSGCSWIVLLLLAVLAYFLYNTYMSTDKSVNALETAVVATAVDIKNQIVGIVESTRTPAEALPKQTPTTIKSSNATARTLQSPTPVPTKPGTNPLFSNPGLQFGGKGNGAGQFDNPGNIAVDSAGNIYVAENENGRVQKFDPQGKFVYLINVPHDRNGAVLITDMAVDYAGKLYVVRGGDILVFNTEDGSLFTTLAGHFPDTIYTSLAIDPSNRMYALHVSASEQDLILLDKNGKTVSRFRNIIAGVDSKSPSLVLKIAVDGLGNVYILSVMANQVFKFDSQGKFQTRISSPGNSAGHLLSPFSIAVDGKGRIYIPDADGLQIFKTDGSFQETVSWDNQSGTPMDVAVDSKNNLYAITDASLVLKYTPSR